MNWTAGTPCKQDFQSMRSKSPCPWKRLPVGNTFNGQTMVY